jgi:flagellar hook assembly protein FlgD
VRHLVDKISPAGDHHTHWDGTDDAGKRVVSGIYLYQLVTDEVITSRKMILLE